MHIRLMGLPDEVQAAITQIRKALDVVEVSAPRVNRGESRQVRVYLTVRLVQPATVTVERETPAARPLGRRAVRELGP